MRMLKTTTNMFEVEVTIRLKGTIFSKSYLIANLITVSLLRYQYEQS